MIKDFSFNGFDLPLCGKSPMGSQDSVLRINSYMLLPLFHFFSFIHPHSSHISCIRLSFAALTLFQPEVLQEKLEGVVADAVLKGIILPIQLLEIGSQSSWIAAFLSEQTVCQTCIPLCFL